MIGYRALPFQAPSLAKRNVVLGQELTPGAAKGVAVGAGLIFTTISAAAAWVGFHTGTTQKSWLGAAGWAVGIAGSLSTLFGLMGTLSVLTLPTAEIERPSASEGPVV